METKTISATVPLESGFTHVLFNLAAQGYDYIRIGYSGSGDSGCIDEIYLAPKGTITIENNELKEHDEIDYALPDGNLRALIENKAYEHVLNDADDWYHNDGGGGTLYISTLDGSYYANHYVNITETIDSVLTGKFGDN